MDPKFSLDIRGLQRSILPVIVLRVIKQNSNRVNLTISQIRELAETEVNGIFDESELVYLDRREIGDYFQAHYSVIYNIVETLRKNKLVEEVQKNRTYSLTESGTLQLKNWLNVVNRLNKLQTEER
jgi:hypothetical protein